MRLMWTGTVDRRGLHTPVKMAPCQDFSRPQCEITTYIKKKLREKTIKKILGKIGGGEGLGGGVTIPLLYKHAHPFIIGDVGVFRTNRSHSISCLKVIIIQLSIKEMILVNPK